VGYVLPRILEDEQVTFRRPTEETVERVVIKTLDRSVVDQELQTGSQENPYTEIYRLQTLGDDHHVPKCLDALCSEDYLYIITPYCPQGTLMDLSPATEAQARLVLRQLLEDLEYLHEQHGICHKDIDPGNCLVSDHQRILLNDLAMSFPMPPGNWVTSLGSFGKPPYWAPELTTNQPFNPRQTDLWATIVTLFVFLTGKRLYTIPRPDDICFRYAILAKGLSSELTNPLVEKILVEEEMSPLEFLELSQLVQAISKLSPDLLELFQKSLTLQPQERWTRQDILQSRWMQQSMEE